MNHGFKINGNILEITLPEEVHIDKVIVNRQIFSQRQRVCESCKYHEKEGHEEPCVSCEVGNSNYVPSVGLEERTEECTETHACDCISRQAAIDEIEKAIRTEESWVKTGLRMAKERIADLPSAQPERPKGEWIKREWAEEAEGYLISNYECSCCHAWERKNSDFCPNCGSYNGGEESEDN